MKTTYENYSDSEVIQALKTRLQFSQAELAEMFYMSVSSISRALAGKIRLRPAVRQAMIDLLDADDHSFVIDGKKDNAEG